MRKSYMMLLALVLSVLGATNALGQKIYQAELDKSMFKAWDGYGANAKEVADPAAIDDGATFGCESNLYRELSAGSVVYGNTNVYYLWYADITGTKKIMIQGTAGLQLRILLNRPAPEEGGSDAHGGTTTELNVTLDENGKGEVDVTELEYVHLNCIKLGWGSPAGVVNSLEILGTVRPVSGYLDLISNGDAEGTDLESFPVSKNGPNNGGTANDRPEVVPNGVNGSNCFKVVSDDDPTETWNTQFYIKFDEALQEGDKWRLSMDVKAERDAWITTSAQAQPRTWNGGFIDPFEVTTEWKTVTFEGTVTSGQANNGGFISAAFDLNNGERGDDGNFSLSDAPNTFYFDNIKFQKDLGGANPLSMIQATYGADVIRLDLADNTNMKELVKAAVGGGKTLIYPNECGSVLWNGKQCNIISIEGRPDGNLYIFLLDMDGEGGTDFEDEEATVVVGFKNPADAALHLVFQKGKWEGEDMPEVSGLVCGFDYDLGQGDYVSYMWGAPEFESAVPEAGSFNLPADTKEFKITFNQNVDVKSVKAKLEKEDLTVSPAEGYAKEITLTRTGSNALDGYKELIISAATGEKGYGLEEDIVVKYSFGKTEVNPDDQLKEILTTEKWMATSNGGIPEGYYVVFGEEERTSENSYGSGSRMFDFGEGGDFTKGLYFREGYVMYGSTEGFELPLEAGKKYNIHFNSAMWKSNGAQMTFQILSADDPDTPLFEQVINNTPNVEGSYAAINGSTSTDISYVPEEDGNYLLKWISNGFVEVLLGNPTVKYIPNVLGIEEIQLLETAIENAKSTRDGNADDRYSGAAFTALDEAIKKYEAESASYTAPSSYKNAAAALDAAAQAVKDHRTLCDNYDPMPEKAQEVINNYADTKFANTDIYKNLKAITVKYATTKTEKVIDEDTGEEVEVTVVEAKEIKDDEELKAAYTELSTALGMAVGDASVARSGKGMFTVGASKVGNGEATCTGIAVLVDRIRMGADALKSLGVAEDDALIVAADNALTDDDELANSIKLRVKSELYGQLKNADNNLFETVVDENTGEETTPSYDMTVFIKNPNIYKLKATNNDLTEENVPGWTVVDGKGLTTGWSEIGTDDIPADAMFSNWGGTFTVYQTIEDLPAGVYSLYVAFSERMGEDEAPNALDGTYIYAKTSATEEGDSLTAEISRIGQAFPTAGPEKSGNSTIEEIEVVDGKLTFGVQAGQDSHVFFNEAKLYMTAPAASFDYTKGYNEVVAGVETTKTAKVRAIQLFDLNGQRINSARKGIVIVKKQMSDGTIRTEKVIKK